jgi:hypothetical protein
MPVIAIEKGAREDPRALGLTMPLPLLGLADEFAPHESGYGSAPRRRE